MSQPCTVSLSSNILKATVIQEVVLGDRMPHLPRLQQHQQSKHCTNPFAFCPSPSPSLSLSQNISLTLQPLLLENLVEWPAAPERRIPPSTPIYDNRRRQLARLSSSLRDGEMAGSRGIQLVSKEPVRARDESKPRYEQAQPQQGVCRTRPSRCCREAQIQFIGRASGVSKF